MISEGLHTYHTYIHTRNYRVNYPRKTKKAKNYHFSVSSEPSSRETPPQSPVAAGRHPLSISKIIHSFIHSLHTSISKMTHGGCRSDLHRHHHHVYPARKTITNQKQIPIRLYVCTYVCMYVQLWPKLSQIRFLNAIDHCYRYKICLYEVFHVIWYY